MNKYIKLILLFVCLVSICIGFDSCNQKKINVLVITGGHDYDKEGFIDLLNDLPIKYNIVEHPNAYPLLKENRIKEYDAILLYDLQESMPPDATTDFLKMLYEGKGLVVLHHAFASFNFWPEYTRIVGGGFRSIPWNKNGEKKEPSTYKHDVTFKVKVADPNHPVTKGIKDFEITDETYGNCEIRPDIKPLLETDEPSSNHLVCWANENRNSRIVTLTLGHDKKAWENPSFKKVLSQALLWTAEKNKVK